jgi:hypothetical protein
MKTEMPQDTDNLTRIVSALIIAKEKYYTDTTDPDHSQRIINLVKLARRIHDEILKQSI